MSATQPAERHAAHRPVHTLTFAGAVRSEWCKMWSAMSTYVLLVLCVAFFAVNSLMIGWLLNFMASQEAMPVGMEDVWTTVSTGATDGMLIVGILGVMVMTSEYSSQSIITSLTVNPRRAMFMDAKALVLAAVTFLASFVGVLVAWGCAWLMVHGAISTGTQAMPAALPWVTLLGVPLAMALTAVMAMGFGTMLRSTVGGVLCVVDCSRCCRRFCSSRNCSATASRGSSRSTTACRPGHWNRSSAPAPRRSPTAWAPP